jgi:hypothetical protein
MLTEADKGAEMEGAEGGRWMKRKRAEGTRGEKQEQQYRGGGKRAGGVREWGSAGGREVYPSTRTIDEIEQLVYELDKTKELVPPVVILRVSRLSFQSTTP